MKQRLFCLLIVIGVAGGCREKPAFAPDTIDAIARDYVLLSLTIGEKEEGYVDSYYGPPNLQAKAVADAPRETLDTLAKRTSALSKRVDNLSRQLTGMEGRRAKFLSAQLTAAATRLRMMRGEKLSFADEAQGLFGLRPNLKPLESYQPILHQIDAMVPGAGPLDERVQAFQSKFIIPSEKQKPVFEAAIAECRARTAQHIALPKGENFQLGFVRGKSWSAYNYYKGHYRSRIDINTDLPIPISRAVEFGCHEGYPGHHVWNTLLEERLTNGRKWIEFSVFPLFSPQAFIAEGSAEYGINLAFPGTERLKYEVTKLYPLAGIPTLDAERYSDLQEAMSKLQGARLTIAQELLDGNITEADAVRLTQHYLLVSPGMARRLTAMAREMRTYIINEGLGAEMVREDVEGTGPSPAERWRRMEQLISEPTLARDLGS
ncbi:MAG TPA: hypothetical protein VGE68_03230 [Sphingomicrobium sp.]